SSSGNSAYSNVTSAATVLPAPSNLSATAVSTSQINLTWTDNSSNQDSVMIERSSDGLSFAQLGTVGANGTSYPDTGLIPGTTYYYQVLAYHASSNSPYAYPASATTFAPPAAPLNLVATAASSSQINLTWTDNSSNEDGFKLYRSTDGVNFTYVKGLAANVTSCSDYDRSPGTTYYYQVLAYNAGGNSPYSNRASVTTPTLPAAPSNLVATAVSSSQINLTWIESSSNVHRVNLYRSTDGVNYSNINILAANNTRCSDDDRSPGTIYYYQVLAYTNAGGNSPYSNTASATTTK